MPQFSSATDAFGLMQNRFNASKAEGVNGSVLLELTGDGGGKWVVSIANGAFELMEGGIESPTTTLTLTAEDFVGLVNGTVNAMAAFMQGKIRLQGDMGLAMKFQTIFGIA